jgi:hypothetical protein
MNDDMYVCPDWDKAISEEIKAIGHPYFFLSATMIEPYNTNNNCVIHHDYGTDLKSFNEDKLLKEYQTFKNQTGLVPLGLPILYTVTFGMQLVDTALSFIRGCILTLIFR